MGESIGAARLHDRPRGPRLSRRLRTHQGVQGRGDRADPRQREDRGSGQSGRAHRRRSARGRGARSHHRGRFGPEGAEDRRLGRGRLLDEQRRHGPPRAPEKHRHPRRGAFGDGARAGLRALRRAHDLGEPSAGQPDRPSAKLRAAREDASRRRSGRARERARRAHQATRRRYAPAAETIRGRRPPRAATT